MLLPDKNIKLDNYVFSAQDFAETPCWVTKALTDRVSFEGNIYEPAAGTGLMARVLADETGLPVFETDIVGTEDDFLEYSPPQDKCPSNIITNPPWSGKHADLFVERALATAKCKVAMLLPIIFLVGSKRQRNIFSYKPPQHIFIFSDRVGLRDPDTKKSWGGARVMWLVWDKLETKTTFEWIVNPSGRLEEERRAKEVDESIEEDTVPIASVSEGSKRCTVCKEVKAFQEFHCDKRGADGLYAQCKQCKSRVDREQYVKSLSKKRATSSKVRAGYEIAKYLDLID